MKKILSIILAAIIGVLTACGDTESTDTTEPALTSDTGTAAENPDGETIAYETSVSTDEEDNALKIKITAGERTFTATLYDSGSAEAFKALLPLTPDMSELNGNEKYYYLPDSLPTAPSVPPEIHAGDIMLYGNSCLVLFYEGFTTSYSYTPIGRMDDPDGLAAALGSGSVRVSFE